VVKRGDNSFKVIYKSEEESDVMIEIFDQKKKLVYHETIRHSSGFIRPYNMNGLDDGDYVVRLNSRSNQITKTISIGKPEKLAQLINLSEGKYLLTVPGKGEGKVHVRVSNELGDTVHVETTSVYGDFAETFDMSKLKGKFTFEISDEHGLTKTISK
jgi:hypothetical protein